MYIFAHIAGSFILTREFPYPSDYGRQAGSGLPSSMVRENMRSEDDDLPFAFFPPTKRAHLLLDVNLLFFPTLTLSMTQSMN